MDTTYAFLKTKPFNREIEWSACTLSRPEPKGGGVGKFRVSRARGVGSFARVC